MKTALHLAKKLAPAALFLAAAAVLLLCGMPLASIMATTGALLVLAVS
jgi:hypothetical protein